jgi:HAD superfamily hydrolase (TIGR01549 family)
MEHRLTSGEKKMLEAFLFDLDGTIWNSKAAAIEAIRETILAEKGKRINKEILGELITQNTPFEVLRLYDVHNDSLFWREYKKRYSLIVLFFDDTSYIFQTMISKKRKMGIVTSLKKNIAQDLLSKFNLSMFFSVMITPSDTTARKPSPKPILLALERLGLTAPEVVYIGDKEIDMLAATNAGCKSGLAEWGNGAKISVTPDYRLKKLRDVVALCRA